MAEEEKRFEQIGKLKEGNYILIDGFPCVIKSIEKSKPGKHGSAKARITAVGVFDDIKRTLLKPTSSDCEVPWIERKKGIVVAVMGGTVQIMDEKTYETLDLPKPKEVLLKASDTVEFLQYGKNAKLVRVVKA